jgi:hypothetical protein
MTCYSYSKIESGITDYSDELLWISNKSVRQSKPMSKSHSYTDNIVNLQQKECDL